MFASYSLKVELILLPSVFEAAEPRSLGNTTERSDQLIRPHPNVPTHHPPSHVQHVKNGYHIKIDSLLTSE